MVGFAGIDTEKQEASFTADECHLPVKRLYIFFTFKVLIMDF
uniref:Uncharacterized protein n=1 Tax=Anguilla anguilla TaxID=7936 RepID=A0A0E9UDH9_ANGAN